MYIGLNVQLHGIEADETRPRVDQALEVKELVRKVLQASFPTLCDESDIIVELEEYTEKA